MKNFTTNLEINSIHKSILSQTTLQIGNQLDTQVNPKPNNTTNWERSYTSKAHPQQQPLIKEQMSASTTVITAGTPKARDVGILCAAFVTDGKWNNTWNIMREYNRAASDNTGPPPLAATWTEMEKDVAPVFQQTEINTSNKSPLSPNPTAEAIKRYNHAVKLMNVFERNSNDANCQTLVASFAQNHLIGDKDFLQTVFLRHAFDEPQHKIIDLTGKTWNNFFSAWAELEVGEEYNDPVFSMDQGMTHAASPIITMDWTVDAYTQEKIQWEINNPPRAPGSMRIGRRWG
ncbi:hypothetical protein MBLNU13_g05211t1 [Cladosporium sp. NU13]